MVKVKGPLASTAASGNFAGKIQYRTRDGKTHAHRAPDPKTINQQPASYAQQAIRARFGLLVEIWRGMSEPERQVYNDQAYLQERECSGWNLFIKERINEEIHMATLLFSSGEPANSFGANGDFCLDYLGFNFYGPKEMGEWDAPTSVITSVDLAEAISGLNLGTAATHSASDFAASDYVSPVVNSSIVAGSAQSITTNGSLTLINFDTASTGDSAYLSAADKGFKVPTGKGGLYKPEAVVVYDYPQLNADSYYCKLQILVNNAVVCESSNFASFPTGTGNRDIRAEFRGVSLAAGDVVTFKAGIKSVNNRSSVLGLDLAYSYAFIEKLS